MPDGVCSGAKEGIRVRRRTQCRGGDVKPSWQNEGRVRTLGELQVKGVRESRRGGGITKGNIDHIVAGNADGPKGSAPLRRLRLFFSHGSCGEGRGGEVRGG